MIPRATLLTAIVVLIGGLFFLAGAIFLSSYFFKEQTPAAVGFLSTIEISEGALAARAAIVYDPMAERVLFSKNAGTPLPLASLTKLMAAQAVLSEHPNDVLITISREALKSEGDSKLRLGEVWSLHDLLTLGLVASSNDAMAAAAESVGGTIVEAMNRTATRLGLTETYFLNPTGLDLDPETSGAYGSARDVAVLAANFLKHYPEFFEASAKQTVTVASEERVLEATSTAAPLFSISGFIGAKTGYTDLAGGNLVAAFDVSLGRPLIVVVLGSTREGRFEDVKTLINAVRQKLPTSTI